MGPAAVVEYEIDADDHLRWVGSHWAPFASANDAPELAVPSAPGAIWIYFVEDEVRHLWQLIVSRVREEVPFVQVPFRCDAPAVRRWFAMTVIAGKGGVVAFRSELLREERRDTVAVLQRGARRDGALPAVRVCSWCNRAHDGDRWTAIEEVVRSRDLLGLELSPGITHGICESCAGSVLGTTDG